METPGIQSTKHTSSHDKIPQDPSFKAEFGKIREAFQDQGMHDIYPVLQASIESISPKFRDLSLGQFIMSRTRLIGTSGCRLKFGTLNERREYELLSDFVCGQEYMRRRGFLLVQPLPAIIPSGTSLSNDPEEEQKLIVKEFNKAWVDLQVHYIKHAKVVLCTASTAGRDVLRSFNPAYILVEEASQISESECLNGIMSGYSSSLQKIILSGDKEQLPPTVLSRSRNECYTSEKLSLFERMIASGVPHIELDIQYRMAPDIAEFVSRMFYGGRLRTDQTCFERPQVKAWSTFMKDRLNCSPGNSFFVSIANTTVLRRKGGTSLVNPEYVSYIGELIMHIIGKNCPQDKIIILSFYSEERRVLTELIHGKLGYGKIQIKSVDASQGNESSIVIASTTRPGGGFGLGFVQDQRRMCVALSRAQNCLVVVGHEGMGKLNKPGAGKGFQAWDRLVALHRERGRLCKVIGNNTLVKKHLGIDLEDSQFEPLRL